MTGVIEPYDALKDVEECQMNNERIRYRPAIDPDSETFSIYSFHWTDTEFTPRELLDNFQDVTPFLVLVTEGFLGRDEWINTVSSDEVYWVRGVITLPRLVVRNEYNAYFSIPVTCQSLVVQNTREGAEVSTVKALYDDPTNNYQTFRFADTNKFEVYRGAGDGECVRMGQLTIVDKYQERYLKVHSLCMGRIYHEPCLVPVYMPVTMAIAVNMDTGDRTQFYRNMIDMHTFITDLPKLFSFPKSEQFTLNTDITMYEEAPNNRIYEVLQATYVTVRSLRAANDKARNDVGRLLRPTTTEKPSARPLPSDARSLNQRGGSRGPQTNISQLRHNGYYVADVDPRLALNELSEVLRTKTIPTKSAVHAILLPKSETPKDENRVKPKTVSANDGPPPRLPPRQSRIVPSAGRADQGARGDLARASSVNANVWWRPVSTVSPTTTRSVEQPQSSSHAVGQPQSSSRAVGQPQSSSRAVGQPQSSSRAVGQPQSPALSMMEEMRQKHDMLTKRRESNIIPEDDITSKPADVKLKGPRTAQKPTVRTPTEEVSSDITTEKTNKAIQSPKVLQPDTAIWKNNKLLAPPKDAQQPITIGGSSKGISSIADIPKDIGSLTCDEIGECLALLKLSKHRDKFLDNLVDGALLKDLTESVLQEDLKLNRFEAIKVVKFANGWRPNENINETSS